MITFIAGLIAFFLMTGCFYAALQSGGDHAKWHIPGTVLGALAAVLIVISCVTYVPTGYTGIVTTFGKVSDNTLDAGIAVKAPWQSVVKMDNRLQETSMELSCFSSDIQEVTANVTVGYRINQTNAMTIYKEIGKQYEDMVITPRVQEAVKTVFAHYDANHLIESRDAATREINETLEATLAAYNIELSYVSITNIDFTDTFTDAVESKVRAQQELEQAQTEAERKRTEAQAEADAAVIAAQAEAEMAQIAADAELYAAQKRAEANQALTQSLSEELLAYYEITQVNALWDGELPQYVGGDTSIPVLDGFQE